MLTLVRPGDESAYTLKAKYNDTNQDEVDNYYTEISGRIDGDLYTNIRRVFNGLGHLIQTQSLTVTVAGETTNILADTWYDDYGRVVTQSVPYTGTATTSGTCNPNAEKTITVYDEMGRATAVTPPDGNQVLYAYDDLLSWVIDVNGNTTYSLSDVWGRVVQVTPPHRRPAAGDPSRGQLLV